MYLPGPLAGDILSFGLLTGGLVQFQDRLKWKMTPPQKKKKKKEKKRKEKKNFNDFLTYKNWDWT
jgi:hypothetical protein